MRSEGTCSTPPLSAGLFLESSCSSKSCLTITTMFGCHDCDLHQNTLEGKLPSGRLCPTWQLKLVFHSSEVGSKLFWQHKICSSLISLPYLCKGWMLLKSVIGQILHCIWRETDQFNMQKALDNMQSCIIIISCSLINGHFSPKMWASNLFILITCDVHVRKSLGDFESTFKLGTKVSFLLLCNLLQHNYDRTAPL